VLELDTARWWEHAATGTVFAELRELAATCAELAHQLDDILLAPGGSRRTRVAWMESGDNAAGVTLAIAPLTVNEVLERDLLQRQRCAIFTGATLRTGSSFRYIRDRLGLWDVKMANVDSPFDYKRSTLLYLPGDIPLPNHPHYQQMVEQAIVEAAVAAGGRTLVLFTSYQQLRATADAIRTPLERHGVSLFQHGQSSRFRLLREYRQAEQAVLLGTRSFWEGIDLPGEELTCLLIARLPFAVPNDPLVAARSAEFEDPFEEYTVPDAVLRFRQGFGRLIRRASDRGVVVLLDSRAWRKDYGSAFLDSLPECTVRRAPIQNLGREVRSWLGRAK
jgi:DNA polymerase-3 subunit epsilon/ATP-dependent DNA helicase DinG